MSHQTVSTEAKSFPPNSRQTWAEIDLGALKDNYSKLCSLISSPGNTNQSSIPYPRIIPVVKTKAYGHGAIQVARCLAKQGAGIFSIGIVEEGSVLRESGISQDLLVLGTNWMGQESTALRHRLILSVDSVKSLESLDKAAGELDVSAPVHIKVDTGMGRLGTRWDSVEPLLNALHTAKNISLKGFFSHLSSADEEDPAYTQKQKRRFEDVLSKVRKAGLDPGEIHFPNSAGLLYHKQFRQWSARTGITLYGYAPDPGRSPIKLRPVLTLKTKVGPIRQVQQGESIGYNRRFTASRITRYSTLPIGYADGFNRKLGNNSRVIIRDGWADVIGTVSMDMIAVDLTDRPDVREGDEVILLGYGKHCSATADTWADTLGTIPYEILCGIASRIPRIYI
ncbi:MAG: alanine racemase [Acidobacteriota bacterium]|jgi:alanine racemase